MKYFYLITILFLSSACIAQKQNVYLYKNDGRLVSTKDSVDFVRIVKEPDTGAVNFKVFDYYKSGQLKFTCQSSTLEPLTFEGSSISYFPNGKRLAIEQFDHGVKMASYTYYPNGKPQAIRQYPEALASTNKYKNFILTNYNDTTGKALVTDGNGYFAGFEIEANDRYAEGKIVNGKKEGIWKGNYPADNITFMEEYHNGNLLKGTCTTEKSKKYTYQTEIVIPNLAYPDGPTLELARSSNVFTPIQRIEVSPVITTQMVSVPAGPTRSLGRTNTLSGDGDVGYTPNSYNLQGHGTVIISFTIDKSGRAINLRVRKSINEDLDRAALKAATETIRTGTDGKPAILLGKPIESQYTLPITF